MEENDVYNLADEIADVTYKLFSEKQQAITSDVYYLERKIDSLEKKLQRHLSNFRTIVVEIERMITERQEESRRERESSNTRISGEIEKLRQMIEKPKPSD